MMSRSPCFVGTNRTQKWVQNLKVKNGYEQSGYLSPPPTSPFRPLLSSSCHSSHSSHSSLLFLPQEGSAYNDSCVSPLSRISSSHHPLSSHFSPFPPSPHSRVWILSAPSGHGFRLCVYLFVPVLPSPGELVFEMFLAPLDKVTK